MVKDVKSFTVEGDAYNLLVKKYKESGVDVSLSLFVNNCLRELSELLKMIKKEIKEGKGYSVPLSFIIKSIVESNDILVVSKDWPDELPERFEFMMQDWQDDYEAQKRKIPKEFYRFVQGGSFVLSPNKKYIIEKKTGKKFITMGSSLVPIDKTIKK
jgi:aminopeptidase C